MRSLSGINAGSMSNWIFAVNRRFWASYALKKTSLVHWSSSPSGAGVPLAACRRKSVRLRITQAIVHQVLYKMRGQLVAPGIS